MRTYFLFLISFLFLVPVAISQNNCDIYYPMKEGAKFQITNYNKKQKVTSVIDYNVVKIQNTSAGTVGTLTTTVKEGKSKVIASQEFDIICKDNKLSVDFETLFDPSMLDQLGENVEYEITGTNLDWPSDFTVGSTLPDASMSMNISMAGMNMTTTVDIINRKVIGQEKVTTPAGTFDCYVLTYDTSAKTMGMGMTTSSKQWVAKGVGMVKQEDSSKGKLDSTSELTLFSL